MATPVTETVRYAITDLSGQSPTTPVSLRELQAAWLHALRHWTEQGVDYVQLREKALEAGALYTLARQGVLFLQSTPDRKRPRLLVNGRPDVALAAGADGVHLPAHTLEVRADQVRSLFHAAGKACILSRSCHTPSEVGEARQDGCDLALFGPVFGKQVRGVAVRRGVGISALRLACESAEGMPVLALGGVTRENAGTCREAGAAGIAGIRLFGAPPHSS